MMWLKKLLFIACCLALSLATGRVCAQTVQINGTVYDQAEKMPMPGVAIMSGDGKETLALTDMEGKFSINVASGSYIIVRFIGFEEKRIQVGKKADLDIYLIVEESVLDEVVVMGYQKRSRETATGASTVITGEEIQDVPVANAMELLQGKVPGLNVQINNGAPGAMASVRVRGLSNINITGQGNEAFLTPTSPLFVIDGVPVDADDNYQYGFSQAGPGVSPLSLIPQEDIARIEVLRDAQATSLYGSRGAYGVILITTKRGQSKVPIIQYTSNFFVSTPPKLRSVIAGVGERDIRINQILQNDTSYAHALLMVNNTPYLADSLNPYYNNATDWQDIFYRTTLNQTHNMNISGGDQAFNYKVNVGYYNEKGIIANTGFQRYNLSMNSQYRPSERFKLFASVTGSLGKNKKGSGSGLLQQGVAENGATSSLLPPPSLFDATNPALSTFKIRDDNNTGNIKTNLDISWEFLKGLQIGSVVSYNYETATRDNFMPAAINDNSSFKNSFVSRGSTLYNRSTLSFNKSFDDIHNINAYVLTEMYIDKYRADQIWQDETPNDQIEGPIGFNWWASRGGTIDNVREARTLGYAGSFSYNYMKKYILSFSYRMDGSSVNGADAPFTQNPSVGLRWNFNKESWLEDAAWIDFGSLRASWGKNIVPVGGVFDAYGRYQAGGNYNNNPTVVLNTDLIPNTNLQPTTTTKLNFGFESGLFNGLLQTTFDVYYNMVDKQLRQKDLPNHNAFNAIKTNEISLVNYGYELSLTLRPLSKNSPFNWTLSVNGALNRDVLTHLPDDLRQILVPVGGDTKQAILYRLGRNSLSNVLYHLRGVYPSTADVPVDPLTGLRYRVGNGQNAIYFQGGDPFWTDLNGDYELDDNDYVVVGNSFPRITGGLNSYLTYKNFSLNVNVSYTILRDILNNALASRFQNFGDPTSLGAIVPIDELDYWKQEGEEATYPYPFDFVRYGRYTPFRFDQTLFQEDGSYWKINNLTLAYTMDRSFTQRFGVSSLRLYLTANNLLTMTNYSGPNPESVTELGRDNSAGYPNRRSYSLGVNVQF